MMLAAFIRNVIHEFSLITVDLGWYIPCLRVYNSGTEIKINEYLVYI